MDRTGWADTVPRVRPWQTTKRSADGLWKRRELEKSKTRLSHLAWKSRKRRPVGCRCPPTCTADWHRCGTAIRIASPARNRRNSHRGNGGELHRERSGGKPERCAVVLQLVQRVPIARPL